MEERSSHCLKDPQQDPSDHSTLDVADTAYYRSDECLEPGHRTHGWIYAEVECREHAAYCSQRGSDGEGKGDDPIDVYAHEHGRRLVERCRPHRLAHPGLVDEEREEDHHRHRYDDHKDLVGRNRDAADMDRIVLERIREAAGCRPEYPGSPIGEDEGDADGGKERGQPVRIAQRLVCDTLDEHAQDRAEGHAGEHGDEEAEDGPHPRLGRPCERLIHQEAYECSYHQDIAMREVDELQDTVDHGISKSYQ